MRPYGSRIRDVALALALLAAGCAPKLDPLDSDQCPDLNYGITRIKDARFVGSLPRIDAAVRERMAGVFPGVAVAIVDAGEIAYMNGYGVAARGAPMTVDTVGGIGPVSQLLTAAAVFRLVELGEVALDAPIASYFPHYVPQGWSQVRVLDLLAHRGGFARDANPALDGAWTPAQVDAAFGEPRASQHPRYAIWEFLLTERGAPTVAQVGVHAYSNIGYTILGAIVDNVTRRPGFAGGLAGYERFVWGLCANAEDAALTAALAHPWRAGDIPGLAGRHDASGAPVDATGSGGQAASTGWSMTIGDLARVWLALQRGEVPGADALSVLDPNSGDATWSLGGSCDGHSAHVIAWPNRGVAVAVLANADGAGAGAIAEAVGRAWLEDRGAKPELSVEDRARMQAATFVVSERHFAGAERAVRSLLGRFGEERTIAFLLGQVGAQGGIGAELAALACDDPLRTEEACAGFLSVLDALGSAGPYRPER